jgi:oligopeptide/dipeptide ABC transporter ATP-binding protein
VSTSANEPIVRVDALRVELRRQSDDAPLKAVNGVSFEVQRGKVLGIVGESGCGKTTVSLSLIRLLPKRAVLGGAVWFGGVNLLAAGEAALEALRGRRIAMIFQDPMVALDPLFTIGEQLAEPLRKHLGLAGEALKRRQIELLDAVGIPAPERRLLQYPHEMSGGMLQRIVGAIAISCDPDLLIADEPTTALDPTAQAEYLELLQRLVRRNGLALVIVTHDIGVVARVCDDVLVMYAGDAVEQGPARTLLTGRARHPYTRALLAAVPGGGSGDLRTIEGQPPSLAALPVGCAFAARCAEAEPACLAGPPPRVVLAPRHQARCYRVSPP